MNFTREYRGIDWEVVFIKTDTRISRSSREHLIEKVIDMYLDKEKRVSVKADDCEGKITTNGKSYCLGAFSGREYVAKLETDYGKMNLGFLVAKKINPLLN